jgi:NAD(P)-dependent dehydrogenase (short-subunit alcohol dehydrogenase family)
METSMKPLSSAIAVVAGATRGAGRGIARMLGEAGATVYCTGRSTRDGGATPGRPETIEETAEMVTREGGRGIPVRVDHTVEADVVRLFDVVRAEAGRLDILVNDVWGGDDLTEWGTPFWESDLGKGRRILEAAVWGHILTARHALPLMVEKRSGLVVEITDGDFLGYRGTLFYDLAKVSAIRLAYALSADLQGIGVTALAVTPGFLRSEAMLARFGVTEENWRDGARSDPHFIESETPCFVGRAVASLAADPNVSAKRGRCGRAGPFPRSTASPTSTEGSRTGEPTSRPSLRRSRNAGPAATTNASCFRCAPSSSTSARRSHRRPESSGGCSTASSASAPDASGSGRRRGLTKVAVWP